MTELMLSLKKAFSALVMAFHARGGDQGLKFVDTPSFREVTIVRMEYPSVELRGNLYPDRLDYSYSFHESRMASRLIGPICSLPLLCTPKCNVVGRLGEKTFSSVHEITRFLLGPVFDFLECEIRRKSQGGQDQTGEGGSNRSPWR